jgi:hypothetical protein
MNTLEEHPKNSNPVQLSASISITSWPTACATGEWPSMRVHMASRRKGDLCQSQLFTIATSGFHSDISQFVAWFSGIPGLKHR